MTGVLTIPGVLRAAANMNEAKVARRPWNSKETETLIIRYQLREAVRRGFDAACLNLRGDGPCRTRS